MPTAAIVVVGLSILIVPTAITIGLAAPLACLAATGVGFDRGRAAVRQALIPHGF